MLWSLSCARSRSHLRANSRGASTRSRKLERGQPCRKLYATIAISREHLRANRSTFAFAECRTRLPTSVYVRYIRNRSRALVPSKFIARCVDFVPHALLLGKALPRTGNREAVARAIRGDENYVWLLARSCTVSFIHDAINEVRYDKWKITGQAYTLLIILRKLIRCFLSIWRVLIGIYWYDIDFNNNEKMPISAIIETAVLLPPICPLNNFK